MAFLNPTSGVSSFYSFEQLGRRLILGNMEMQPAGVINCPGGASQHFRGVICRLLSNSQLLRRKCEWLGIDLENLAGATTSTSRLRQDRQREEIPGFPTDRKVISLQSTCQTARRPSKRPLARLSIVNIDVAGMVEVNPATFVKPEFSNIGDRSSLLISRTTAVIRHKPLSLELAMPNTTAIQSALFDWVVFRRSNLCFSSLQPMVN